MIPETKVCGKCGIQKKACEFPLRKKNNGKYVWLRMQCYECMRAWGKERYVRDREKIIKRNLEYETKNKEKVAAKREKWRQRNYEKIKEHRAEKYLKNAEQVKANRKEYYQKNKEKVISLNNSYVERNKPKVRKRQRALHARKKKDEVGYWLTKVLRTRVTAAIKNKGVKCKSTVALVGCSMQELIIHLEKQFKDGMTWDNHGFFGWHIDHIKPCAKFDMSNPEEQKRCFHYTNLQPLWWIHNLKKGSKTDYKAA